MTVDLKTFEGIGSANMFKLISVGVQTPEELLERAASRKDRRALSAATQINENDILTWVKVADLVRIKGISPKFAELLKMAGVDTVRELSTRHHFDLFEKLVGFNAEKKLVKIPPSLDKIENVIRQARNLEPIVSVF